MTITNYTDEMLEALRANIEYLKTVGSSQIKIRNGELVDEQGDLYIYAFELDFLQNLDVDAEIEVRVHNQSATGKVIALSDNKLQIQLDTNLGTHISDALLIVSSYFLLERLVEFLEGIKDGSNLSDKVFGSGQPTNAEDSDYTIPAAELPLNPSQASALRFALGSDVSFIWGPPGTGKTQTIASIIQGLISKNFSTLLISHTNAATDSALLMAVKHLQSTKDYHEGRFIREGKIGNKELAKYKVIPEVILEEKVKPLREEIEANIKKLSSLESKIQAHKAAHFMMADKDELDAQINTISGFIAERTDEFNQTRDYIKFLIGEVKNIDEQINTHQNKGAFGRLFSGTNMDSLTHNKALRMQEGKVNKDTLISIGEQVKHAKQELKRAAEKAEEYEAKFKREGLLSDAEEADVEIQIKNLKVQQEKLLNEIEKIKDDLILNAKVVASTLTMSYTNKKILSREYDCVILDEASMAPLPAIYSAASIAKKKVILVGDFYQLPPIAKHEVNPKGKTDEEVRYEEQLIQKWLKRDVFDLAGITGAIKQGKASPLLRQLKIQYRMHPDISQLVNYLVYSAGDGKYRLEDAPNTSDYGKSRQELEPLKSAHLGFYDTSEMGTLPVKSESGSYYNLPQALLCVELAKQGLKSGYKTIGIISAYRAQTNLVKKMLEDALSDDDRKRVIADTVHRFQGGERKLIIFDVTTAKSPSMYDDHTEEGDDMKLMNVAFSRAEEKCIIVGDIKGIKSKHSESSLVKKAVEFCEVQHHPIIPADDLLPKYLANDQTELWLAKINLANLEKEVAKTKIFSEEDFYPAFIHDLLKAKEEVIICSPFITANRMKQFKPMFNFLIEKGVRIFLITKPPDTHKDAMRDVAKSELTQLEKIGVTVLPIIGMHEKVAIIDRKLIYVGSLNILSQRDSRELMHRFRGNNVANQLTNFLKIDKNIGPLGENNLKHCEVCTAPGSWYWTQKGRYGVWTFCLTGTHAPNKQPKTQEDRKKRKAAISKIRQTINLNADGIPVCPVCGTTCVLKRGPFSEFYGCREHDYAVSKSKVDKLRIARV